MCARYTASGPNSLENAVYAIVLDWPLTGYVVLSDPVFGPETDVTMLGSSETIEVSMILFFKL